FAHIGQISGANPVGWPGNVSTNELGVTYLAFTAPAGTRFVGDRYRLGGEFTYAVGPWMLRGEAMQRRDEVFIGTSYNNLLATTGYYVETAFVVTGEDRTPNARLVPKNVFSLKDGGWGALELVGRIGTVSLDREILGDLATNFAVNSNRVTSITLGFNWWPVQNVRLSLDYIGDNYYQGVQLSGSHHGSHVNGVLARFQVDF
ncbi:MAG: hypothetical protein HY293_21625, partial [Planctomycetes bacterium]|nr:hypothetical protein [Planctomycetota bacterium]